MVSKNIALKRNKNEMREYKKELTVRVLSSLMFIPVIALLYFSSFTTVKLICAVAFAIAVYETFSLNINGRIALRLALLIFCAAGICCFIYCRSVYGVSGCIFLVCVASFTDTGAYFVGKALGGPKLCPKISPKKTWAGFFGGILLSNTACYCLNPIFLSPLDGEKNLLPPNVFGFFPLQCLILASIFGDFVESWFKRKIGVKDMGNLFPGHGGVLDRLDSLIGASVFLFLMHLFIGV